MLDTSTNLSKVSREQMVATLTAMKSLHPEQTEALNQILTFVKSQKYGLNFEKHIEQVDIALQNHLPVFKPFKQIDNGSPEDGYNFLLEGDNLHSLKLLEKTHTGAVDVIYIDPPYNTLNDDFIYGDKMIDSEDGFKHSKWLSFMEERLKIAKKLLSDTGMIFLSIDDREYGQLKLLCDEIFGELNFVASIPRKTSDIVRKTSAQELQVLHDYILVYRQANTIFHREKTGENKFPYSDASGNYRLKAFQNSGPAGTREARPNLYYPIYKNSDGTLSLNETENTIEEILPHKVGGKDGRWLWSKEKFQKDWKKLGFSPKGTIGVKEYESDTTDHGIYQMPKAWLDHYKNNSGTKTLNTILKQSAFSYPKPVELIKWLISLHPNINATVLDFFAGSGTTGQATIELNQEDGGKRTFILCTNNEKTAFKTLEYLHDSNLMLDCTGGSKNVIVQNKINKFLENNPTVYNKLFVDNSRKYETYGICQSVTFPRLSTIITGIRPDGSKYSDGIPCNLKYFQTDMVEKYERDDDGNYLPYVSETLRADLSNYIETLIELQDGINLPSERTAVIWDAVGIDELMEADTAKLQTVYMDLDTIETSAKQERFINRLRNHGVEFRNIPKYYYKEVA